MSSHKLSHYFIENHPRETARTLENFAAKDVISLLESLPLGLVANLVNYMLPDLVITCLSELDPEKSADILERVGADSAARLLNRMSMEKRNNIINRMNRSSANRLRLVLKYPSGTIGHHMSPNIFVASEDMEVGDILVSAKSANSEILGDVYIVDDRHLLVGVVDMKSLVLSSPDEEVQQIMNLPDTVLNVRTNLEYVRDHPKWRFKEALPVIDQKHIFVGVLKRSILNEVTEGSQIHQDTDVDVMEMIFDIGNLFWEVCFSFVQKDGDSASRSGIDERRK